MATEPLPHCSQCGVEWVAMIVMEEGSEGAAGEAPRSLGFCILYLHRLGRLFAVVRPPTRVLYGVFALGS